MLESPCSVRIAPPNSTIVTDGTPIMVDSNVLSAPDVAKSLPSIHTRISPDIDIRYE